MKRLFAMAQVCSLVFIAACAAEEVEEAPMGSADPVGEPAAFPVDGVSPSDGVDDGAGARAGCAYVQYCDKPNSHWGTLCVRTGCSEQAAWDECYRDAIYVCGRITPDWGMYL